MRTWIRIALLSGLLVPRGGWAQAAAPEPPPAGTPADEQAQRLSDDALEAYKAGKFGAAARLYQKAYNLRADPALLYNLAKTYDKMNRKAEALDSYRRYLESEGTDARLRTRAIERITALSGSPPVMPPTQPTPAPTATLPGRTSPAPSALPAPPPKPRPPGRPLLWAGVGLAAVGAAGLITGVALYGVAAQSRDQFNASQDELDKRAARERAQSLGLGSTVSYAVGGAVLLGGAALIGVGIYKGRRPAGKERARLGVPVLCPLPDGAAWAWGGTF